MQHLLEELRSQEERLVFPSFTHETGIAVGEALLAAGREARLPIAIDVSAFGQTVFHAALPGTAPDNDEWIRRKQRVVHRFQQSSYLVGRELAARGLTIEERWFVSSREFSPHGGCFPIRLTVRGGVIGTVTVSGLTEDQDHQLVVDTIGRMLATDG